MVFIEIENKVDDSLDKSLSGDGDTKFNQYLNKIKFIIKAIMYVLVLIIGLLLLSILNYHRNTDINITEDYKLSTGFQNHLDRYIKEADEYIFDDKTYIDKKGIEYKISQKFMKDLSSGFDVRYIRYNYIGDDKVILNELDTKITNLIKIRDYLEVVVSNDILNNSYKDFVYQSEDKSIKVIDKTIEDLKGIKKGIVNLKKKDKSNKVLKSYQSYVKNVGILKEINKTKYLYE